MDLPAAMMRGYQDASFEETERTRSARAARCIQSDSAQFRRMAYGVRDAHIADPEAMRVAVAALLDKGFAKTLAARIDPAITMRTE
mgnify:CR=1 FL=1